MRKLEIAIAGLSGLGLVLAIVVGTAQQYVPAGDALAPQQAPLGALGVMQVPHGQPVVNPGSATSFEKIAPAAGKSG